MTQALSVVVAAAPDHAEMLLAALRRGGFELRHAVGGTPGALGQALAKVRWDVLLAVDDLPSLTLDTTLAMARPLGLPVLLLAGSADIEAARAALRAGAADVIWPAQLDRLPLAVERLLLNRPGVTRAAVSDGAVDVQQEFFVGNHAVQLLVDPKTGQVVDANPAAAEFYGYALDDLRQMTAWQLSTNDDETVRANLTRPFSEPGSVVTARHRLASGAVRDVEIHASPVQQGERSLLYGIIHDVTERRLRERELEAVAAFAAALRTAPSRATLAPAIVEQLRKLTGANSAALVLRDPGSGELVTEAAVNWPQPTGSRSPPGAGLAGRVIASGQTEWRRLGPLSGAPDSAPGREAQLFAVGAPLVAQGQTLGALCVSSAAPPGAAQLRLLSAVSDMAANALNRSTLYEQTEQRVQRLAVLHAIDIAITASFDLRVTLGIFLDHLVGQMRVDAAAVLLLNSGTQTLDYAAMRGLNTRPLRQAPLRLSDSVPGRVVTQRQALHLGNLVEARPSGTQPYPPGQSNFAGYYGVPLVAKGRVLGVLEVLNRGPLHPDSEWVEFFNSLATQASIAIDNATLFTDLQRSNVELNLAYDATIEGWSRVLEARGIESSGHTRRVAELAVKLAEGAGFGPAELIDVRRGALLHDVGMLSIPESVLLKPGPLSEAERAIVQQHPDYGFGILAPIVYLRQALDIPYCHHERWDGTGYPRGLRGDLIPLAARLFAVVDTWDALRAEKPYRAAWSEAEALAYLEKNAGQQFDPEMVRLFREQGVNGND
jgi:PAS domain S-box-containing protein